MDERYEALLSESIGEFERRAGLLSCLDASDETQNYQRMLLKKALISYEQSACTLYEMEESIDDKYAELFENRRSHYRFRFSKQLLFDDPAMIIRVPFLMPSRQADGSDGMALIVNSLRSELGHFFEKIGQKPFKNPIVRFVSVYASGHRKSCSGLNYIEHSAILRALDGSVIESLFDTVVSFYEYVMDDASQPFSLIIITEEKDFSEIKTPYKTDEEKAEMYRLGYREGYLINNIRLDRIIEEAVLIDMYHEHRISLECLTKQLGFSDAAKTEQFLKRVFI